MYVLSYYNYLAKTFTQTTSSKVVSLYMPVAVNETYNGYYKAFKRFTGLINKNNTSF